MAAVNNYLYLAKVFHKRTQPRVNSFTYNVYYLSFPLSQLAQLRRPMLSVNRFNLLSFFEKDHGSRDGAPLEPWIKEKLAQFGVTAADGEIILVCHPRILWHVFNPVSFWFCLDKAGALRAVLAEVNNTFGERHSYLVAHPDQRVIEADDTIVSDKVFHVSPFFHVLGKYYFRFHYSEEKIAVWLDYETEEGILLKTALTGRRISLNSYNILKIYIKIPLVTLRTLGLIHWQAAKLLFKRIRYVPKPPPPTEEISR